MNRIYSDVEDCVRNQLPAVAYRVNTAQPVLFAKMAVSYEIYTELNLTSLLGRVRAWGVIGELARHHFLPLPYLEKEHLGTFNVNTYLFQPTPNCKAQWETVLTFRQIYDQVAWNILALIHMDILAEPKFDIYGELLPTWPSMPVSKLHKNLGGPPNQEDIFLHSQVVTG